jgi:hypothetical protein
VGRELEGKDGGSGAAIQVKGLTKRTGFGDVDQLGNNSSIVYPVKMIPIVKAIPKAFPMVSLLQWF